MALQLITSPARLNDNANYPGLTDSLADAKIYVEQQWPGGLWYAKNAAAAQTFIDAYDPVPYAKNAKKVAIKADGLVHVQIIYPAINNMDVLDLEFSRWSSFTNAAKNPTADYQKMLDTRTAWKAAIAQVNAATTVAQVNAVTPVWP
jgi:hypothetical protein